MGLLPSQAGYSRVSVLGWGLAQHSPGQFYINLALRLLAWGSARRGETGANSSDCSGLVWVAPRGARHARHIRRMRKLGSTQARASKQGGETSRPNNGVQFLFWGSLGRGRCFEWGNRFPLRCSSTLWAPFGSGRRQILDTPPKVRPFWGVQIL